MSRSKSSGKWLREHFDDPYVKQSQIDGYRSRSAYKLIEINNKYKILNNGTNIVDLGAAPGGWIQAITKSIKPSNIIGLDLLEIEPINGAKLIVGDFTDNNILDDLLKHLDNKPLDLVLSDMAPNMSGHTEIDIPRSMYLAELAQDFANMTLKKEGHLVMKVFQGEGFDTLLKSLRTEYKKVMSFKPKSSRPRSKELYLVCKNKKHQA